MKNIRLCILILIVSCTRQAENVSEQTDTTSISDFIIRDEQTIARLNKVNFVEEYTLVDNELKMKFVLDSQRISISAYDFSDKLIWQTDPWLDNKLMVYRVKRPLIKWYSFKPNWGDDDKQSIWISYTSSQFGTVERRTGKFRDMGRD